MIIMETAVHPDCFISFSYLSMSLFQLPNCVELFSPCLLCLTIMCSEGI